MQNTTTKKMPEVSNDMRWRWEAARCWFLADPDWGGPECLMFGSVKFATLFPYGVGFQVILEIGGIIGASTREDAKQLAMQAVVAWLRRAVEEAGVMDQEVTK